MANLSYQKVSEWILSTEFIGNIRLNELIINILTNKCSSMSLEAISEFSMEYEARIFEFLSKSRESIINDQIVPNFDLEEDSGLFYYYGKKNEYKDILDIIISKSPEEFEILCSEILSRLGGNSDIIPGKNDHGIDFIAENISIGTFSNSNNKSKIIVIGQAKRYSSNNITENDLRQFIGASMYKRSELIKSNNLGLLQGIIYAFWTTSDFNLQAKDLARKMGLWICNGFEIAKMVVDLEIKI